MLSKYICSPELWAKCLCGTCHTLYFMVLPSMLSLNVGKEKAILQQAYELLVRAMHKKLACDEVCYRLMMQLCGEHSRPLLAVKLLVLMKKYGIQPNALTYGLYNRCVLEAEWPAYSGSSQLLWNKLRNVVLGAAHFRWAAKRKAVRKLSASTEGGEFLTIQTGQLLSSLDSHEAIREDNNLLDKFRKVASIVKGSFNGLEQTVVDGGENIEDENFEEEASQSVEKKVVTNYISPDSPSEYRLLSRSESAGDANIIDKLQNNKKPCSRSLQFNGEGGEVGGNLETFIRRVSPREVVTENDPLGAFEEPQPTTLITPAPTEVTPSIMTNSTITDEPILFRSSCTVLGYLRRKSTCPEQIASL
ncbi:hypothetical protein NQ317_016760 [Molorchus minor]|uniref:Uncharacterized protein n=1 Tax=Molorchus minor TaxID=1323400 RepID=A0ABQ9JLS5_9CUCU|nr:hypothetical protein NQ317_016760 [Molorchus minor]